MAKLLPEVIKDKCRILHCSYRMCQKCWHWYDPKKPKHECKERPKPARELLNTCPTCRAGFGRHRHRSWSERDQYERYILKISERHVYVREHPVRNDVRVEMQARNTRATNAARAFRSAR